jgi:hypothetical protein
VAGATAVGTEMDFMISIARSYRRAPQAENKAAVQSEKQLVSAVPRLVAQSQVAEAAVKLPTGRVSLLSVRNRRHSDPFSAPVEASGSRSPLPVSSQRMSAPRSKSVDLSRLRSIQEASNTVTWALKAPVSAPQPPARGPVEPSSPPSSPTPTPPPEPRPPSPSSRLRTPGNEAEHPYAHSSSAATTPVPPAKGSAVGQREQGGAKGGGMGGAGVGGSGAAGGGNGHPFTALDQIRALKHEAAAGQKAAVELAQVVAQLEARLEMAQEIVSCRDHARGRVRYERQNT